ncbi:MAG: ABC transporter ATP-binding protein, partial [Patescibacteria group bacterium]
MLTWYIGAFVGLERFMVSQAWQIAQLFEHTNYLNSFRTLEQLKPMIIERVDAEVLSSIETLKLIDVSYTYPNTTIFALEHVSFSIKKGDRLAIVGENGAGKSTLVKIMMRLYEPTSGTILINGKDYRDYTLESLRKQIGVTFQDFEQYSLTVRENIGVGELAAMDNANAIQLAAEQSGIHQKILGLTDTY